MVKSSPAVRSFNAGEVSQLVEGRTDLDRYPSSNRKLLNYIAAPQGPAIPRSGTQFINEAFDNDSDSILIPFVFDEQTIFMLEFADQVARFFTETGILVKTAVAMTVTDDSPFTFTSADLSGNVGDQVVFGGFDNEYNLDGVVGTLLTVSGTTYTVDTEFPALAIPTGVTVALVYSVVSPYDEDDLIDVRDLQSLDVIYLTSGTKNVYKLKHNNTYNWTFEVVKFVDGPYLDENETATRITPSSRGIATPTMTSNSAPSGAAFGDSISGSTHDYFKAFDDEAANTYWEGDVAQVGTIGYQFPSGKIVDGYSIYVALDNADVSYQNVDYAPSTFTFSGSNDGSTYTVLDSQNVYVLYDDNKSVFFKVKNNVSYTYYKLQIKCLTRNGAIKPRVRSFVLRSTDSTTITLTANSTTGINNNLGFLSTDIGRLIRLQGSDSNWRSVEITDVASTTSITVKLLGEPFPDTSSIANWRLGYYSDTTGYPYCLTFWQDRLWLGGNTTYPDLVVGSNSGDYENMAETDPDGTVLDTNAIVIRLNSRRLSRVRWLEGNDKALLIGTGSQEFVLTTADGSGKDVTPNNVKAPASSSRGSTEADALGIDSQVLFIPRSGRAIREMAYVFDSDGFKSPSMSTLASHLGVSPFVKMAYAAEPYSIVWVLRTDGKVVGLTYNRDENVVGWHRHDFSGGIIESIAVIPALSGLNDDLWMIIRRTINGVDKRYVERLMRFWDFDMTLDDAFFVDCGLQYSGDPISVVYGAQHLEARTDVYGLADGTPVGPLVVTDGSVTLDFEASNIVLGIGFDAEGATERLENGAQDGTAQGKTKRVNNMSLLVWSSYGGQVGTKNGDTGKIAYGPAEYPTAFDEVETIELYDGILGTIIMEPNYEKDGSIYFRRPKESPLPFNIVALMPQLTTQDR